jgi:hypothetical protein
VTHEIIDEFTIVQRKHGSFPTAPAVSPEETKEEETGQKGGASDRPHAEGLGL